MRMLNKFEIFKSPGCVPNMSPRCAAPSSMDIQDNLAPVARLATAKEEAYFQMRRQQSAKVFPHPGPRKQYLSKSSFSLEDSKTPEILNSETSSFNQNLIINSPTNLKLSFPPDTIESCYRSNPEPCEVLFVSDNDNFACPAHPNNVHFVRNEQNVQVDHPFGDDVQVIYAAAAATMAPQGDDKPAKLRLLYAEAIGIQKPNLNDSTESGQVQLYYAATTPNQDVGNIPNPHIKLDSPKLIHITEIGQSCEELLKIVVSPQQDNYMPNAPPLPIEVSFNGVTAVAQSVVRTDRNINLVSRARAMHRWYPSVTSHPLCHLRQVSGSTSPTPLQQSRGLISGEEEVSYMQDSSTNTSTIATPMVETSCSSHHYKVPPCGTSWDPKISLDLISLANAVAYVNNTNCEMSGSAASKNFSSEEESALIRARMAIAAVGQKAKLMRLQKRFGQRDPKISLDFNYLTNTDAYVNNTESYDSDDKHGSGSKTGEFFRLGSQDRKEKNHANSKLNKPAVQKKGVQDSSKNKPGSSATSPVVEPQPSTENVKGKPSRLSSFRSSTSFTNSPYQADEQPSSSIECKISNSSRHNPSQSVSTKDVSQKSPSSKIISQSTYTDAKSSTQVFKIKKSTETSQCPARSEGFNESSLSKVNLDGDSSPEVKKKKKRSPVLIHDHIEILQGEPPMYQCNVCMKKFKTKAHIKYHEFCQNGEKPFKCDQCGQGFIAKSHFEYHLRTHTGERPYVCPKCGKGFNQRGKVTRHIRSHTGEKPFVCQQCGRGFANAQALKSHFQVHTGERPFVCQYCNNRFSGMTNLKKHVITHTGERPFICSHCGKSFGLKWTLDLHLRTHSSERPYACDQCNRAFSNSKDLRRHLVIHSGERPFKCWICGTAFRRKDNLDRHIKNTHNQPKEVAKQLANEAAAEYLTLTKSKNRQPQQQQNLNKITVVRTSTTGPSLHIKIPIKVKPTERPAKVLPTISEDGELTESATTLITPKPTEQASTGERPYVCPKCGKGFNQRGKITHHMRSHIGKNSFVCQQCGRGFANPQALRSHFRIHTGERPFACQYCNKRFNGVTNLKKHVITHTGEGPFMCSHCGKSFGLKWILDLHLRTHPSERPYSCDQCNRAFSNSKDLRRHLVIHSGERPFKCCICGTAFRRKDNLDRHIKNTHNQPEEVETELVNKSEAASQNSEKCQTEDSCR